MRILASLEEIRALEPIAEEEIHEWEAAIASTERHANAFFEAARQERPAPVWKLINEARDARTQALADVVEPQSDAR